MRTATLLLLLLTSLAAQRATVSLIVDPSVADPRAASAVDSLLEVVSPAGAGRFQFDVAAPSTIDRAGAVHCLVVRPHVLFAHLERITDFVRAGGGCVVVGLSVPKLPNEGGADMFAFLGLKHSARFVVSDRDDLEGAGQGHPVSRATAGWDVAFQTRGVPEDRFAEGTTPVVNGLNDVLAWTRTEGRGRILVTDLGWQREANRARSAAHLLAAIEWACRRSPPTPAGAASLFAGKDTGEWVMEKTGAPIDWPVRDGVLEVGKGSIMTRKAYGDFHLHVEFLIPGGHAPEKANSGVYLQRRYEIQILNTSGLPPKSHHCGALYRFRPPDVNAAFADDTWQTYDITFRQPRWKDGKKAAPARITVLHNGLEVHWDVALTKKTGAGKKEGPQPGPILLQDHGAKVRFRNIWIKELKPE